MGALRFRVLRSLSIHQRQKCLTPLLQRLLHSPHRQSSLHNHLRKRSRSSKHRHGHRPKQNRPHPNRSPALVQARALLPHACFKRLRVSTPLHSDWSDGLAARCWCGCLFPRRGSTSKEGDASVGGPALCIERAGRCTGLPSRQNYVLFINELYDFVVLIRHSINSKLDAST